MEDRLNMDKSITIKAVGIAVLLVFLASAAATPVSAAEQEQVKGKITTGLDIPVTDQKLTLKKQANDTYETIATTTTNSDGEYSFTLTERGDYLVTFTRNGIPYSRHFRFTGFGETIDFDVPIVNDEGTIAGYVQKGEKDNPSPINGIKVTVIRAGEIVETTKTGENGAYIVTGLDPGSPYTVEITRNGFKYQRQIETDDDPLTFQRQDFDFTASLKGNVEEMVEGEKSTAEDVPILLKHGDSTAYKNTQTDAEGTYEFANLLKGETYRVEVVNEPYTAEAIVKGATEMKNITLYRSSPVKLTEKQMFIMTQEGKNKFGLQEFLMLDPESVIANGDIEKFESGVATVDFTLRQPVPENTERVLISPMMGQGVGEDTELNASLDKSTNTAVLKIDNYKVDISQGDHSIGATYRFTREPKGFLNKQIDVKTELMYDSGGVLLYDRIPSGNGTYNKKTINLVGLDTTQNQYGVYRLVNMSKGDTVHTRIKWRTYSDEDLKKLGAGVTAIAVVIVIGAVYLRRRET